MKLLSIPPSTVFVLVTACLFFAFFRGESPPVASVCPVEGVSTPSTQQPTNSLEMSDDVVAPQVSRAENQQARTRPVKDVSRRGEVALLLQELPQTSSGRRRRPAKSPPASIFTRQHIKWEARATPLELLASSNSSTGERSSSTCRSSTRRPARRRWKFVEYLPSNFERRWLEEVQRNGRDRTSGEVLKLILDPQFVSDFEQLLAGIRQYAMPQKPFAGWALEEDCFKLDAVNEENRILNPSSCGFVGEELNSSVFSRMKYEYRCWAPPCEESRHDAVAEGSVHYSFIEPLVGLLRHPAFQSTAERQGLHRGQEIGREEQFLMEHKAYMLVDKWALHRTNKATYPFDAEDEEAGQSWKPCEWDIRRRDSQSFFFDLGASTWASGAGAASQPWFYGVSWCMCKPFQHWALWELKPVHPVHVFLQLPPHIAPDYKWYNIPLSTSNSSWHNPINQLLHHTRPSDTVFMKVDYDNSAMEAETIAQILRHEAVSSRIDELFFEHHVQMDVMALVWQIENKTSTYLSDSIRLFQQLRRRGVRAHSWV